MPLRKAYNTFRDYLRGKSVYEDALDEAMRIYMNTVDDLIAEIEALSVDLKRAKNKLRHERKLKEKYLSELKERRKDGDN